MPLYTYVASYRGETYADQLRSSNFKGFAGGVIAQIPPTAIPSVSSLRSQMVEKAMRCDWETVPNRKNLWRSAFDLDGDQFTIFAIQTEA